MESIKFSVVIATYNRLELLIRAIKSVKNIKGPSCEIIIVDDFSSDNIQRITEIFPEVKYLRQSKNMGPGPARDRGIKEASGDYIIILDDDDEILPDSIYTIERYLDLFSNYPVIQFAHLNGSVKSPSIVRLEDYILGTLQGDFTPVIKRELFLRYKLCYPDNRIGGEHLLWWYIAKQWGIPTLPYTVMKLNSDAQERLTSPNSQIRKASEHFSLAEDTIRKFGRDMFAISPHFYGNKLLGAITYAALSGKKINSLIYIKRLFVGGFFKELIMGIFILLIPRNILIYLFRRFRA